MSQPFSLSNFVVFFFPSARVTVDSGGPDPNIPFRQQRTVMRMVKNCKRD